jgi:hypothetical protein
MPRGGHDRSDDVPATTMPDTRIRPGIDARAIIIIPSLP